MTELLMRNHRGAKPFLIPAGSREVREKIVEVLAGTAKTTMPRLGASVPSVARAKYEYVLAVVECSGGNVSEAARRLGTHRRTVERILEKRPARR